MSAHSVAASMRLRAFLLALTASVFVAGLHAQQKELPVPVPGRNSNLASGPAELVVENINGQPVATKVRGDFLLKQDNEGSCARGSRNPKNILCGGNDYGLVDVPGIDPEDVVRDAGPGVYQSADGGDTWESTMLRGHVLDSADAGFLKNYKAFADVVVRSGAAGIAYYSGIAFKSVNNTSIAYLATFLELNNREDDRMPFKHLYTVKLDSVPETLITDPLTATAFIDKPWSVVLPPTGAMCTIDVPRPDGTSLRQTIPDSPVVVGYSIFLGLEKNPDLRITAEMMVRVTNCGRNVSSPMIVGIGNKLNGMSLAVSPRDGSNRVVGVWRRFANPYVDDALFAVVSNDGGVSWSTARQVASICPFEQASTGFTARVNTFPTVAIDHTNRISVAWSDRLRDPSTGQCLEAGQSRIVLSTSNNGSSWSSPSVVDPGNGLGHQITPSLTYGGGTMLLLWKDLRETAANYHDRFISEFPLIKAAVGDPVPPPPPPPSGPPFFHHTIEVYSKMANVANSGLQWGPAVRLSQYKFGKSPGETEPTQKQWEIINLKMFARGTKVFDGDYADAAGPPMIPPDPAAKRSSWMFDTGDGGSPTFYGVWTSNRDVHRVAAHTDPTGTQPIPYTPPALTGTSWVDPTQTRPACVPGVNDFTKTMDQNLYGARIGRGLYAFSPGNNKQVTTFQRAYVVTVRNDSTLARTYQLTIPSQFRNPVGGFVSFSQLPPFDAANATRLVTVAPKSTASRSVFIIPDDDPNTTLNPKTLVRVDVTEVGAGNSAPSTSVYINSDPSAPEIEAPEIEAPEIEATEVYTPEIEAAEITAHTPGAPEIEAPEIEATGATAPEIEAPEIEAKSFQTPEIEAPEIEAPEIEAPEIEAPEIEAAAITDVSWPATNIGNTAAGYVIRPLVGGDRTGFHFQLVVSRIVLIPTAKECQPAFATMNKVALNLKDANALVDAATIISAEELANATIWIAPGETVLVTLRVRGDVTFNPALNPTVLNVTPQAIDTVLLAGGTTTPPTFTQPALPNLVFVVQPSDTTNGGTPDPPVQVLVRDNSGAPLPGVQVALSFGPGSPEGAELGGNLETTDETGIATFSELTISGAGPGFTLIASVPGVSSVSSTSFNVTNPITFLVTTEADSGAGSLRQAILDANANTGSVNTINFNIIEPAEGPIVIALDTPLPPVTNSAVIDGYSQIGSALGSPRIVVTRNPDVDVSIFLGASGLTLQNGSSVVQGLIINGFAGPGITIVSSENVIRGNFIGTNENGNEAAPNAQGISIGSGATGNFIGSDDIVERNIIGGNSEFGMIIEGHGNTIRGNVIGVDPNPEVPIGVPNGPDTGLNGAGIMLLNGASNNYIGGTSVNPLPNWIGQNGGEGIVLSAGGVAGGTAAGSGNGIGINQIVGNRGLGIDLGDDGMNINDVGDGDAGPNDLQNSPEVTSAVWDGEATTVSGRLSSTPNTTYKVSVYVTPSCPGPSQGQYFLGSSIVFADEDGVVEFANVFGPPAGLNDPMVGSFITAFASTVTDAEINPLEVNSSEFSSCREVLSGLPPDGFNMVWVGGSPLGPQTWDLAENWSSKQVPSSEDDVYIQSTPEQPVVINPGASSRRLTLAPGTVLTLDDFGLNAHGDVNASDGLVVGAAGVSMVSGTLASVSGNFNNLRVYGQVVGNGPIDVSSSLSIPGDFSPGAGPVFVGATLSTEGNGVLRMNTPAIVQTHDAVFGGGSTSGLLTAGTLRIGGSFLQSGDQQSFVATGTHLTIFNSLNGEAIAFTNPGAETSRFNDLRLDVSGDITLKTGVFAGGQLITTGPTPPIVVGGGNTLVVSGLNVFRLILDNARLISSLGVLTRFDDVTFQSFTGTAPLLTIQHSGAAAPFTVNDVFFDPNPALTAPFLAVLDFVEGEINLPTHINLVGASPASGATGCSRTLLLSSSALATWNGTPCGG